MCGKRRGAFCWIIHLGIIFVGSAIVLAFCLTDDETLVLPSQPLFYHKFVLLSVFSSLTRY